jgi:hypothetical protein
MMKRTFKADAQPDGQGGASAVIFDKSSTGFSPADTMATVQISATGLDGGTYAVKFMPVDGFDYVDFEPVVAQSSAVLMSEGFLIDAVKIEFANLGASAAPQVAVTFISRSF